ncbi:hypothetical protein ACMYM8_23110, partial [Salmonella enterica subsp. enterica serovar Enteritidis]|uniref:hypothetical protein n=1 Tax=Salmonella enterica TaxID=28901 RepID=UPI0039E83709
LEEDLPEDATDDFRDWLASIKQAVLGPLGEFQELVDKISEANPENQNIQQVKEHLTSVHSFWKQLSYNWIMEDYQPLEDELIVQLTESETGRPVS